MIGISAACQCLTAADFLRLSVKEYRDKMKAGWIGQIAGVSWGAPTEFKWRDQIIPADKMPAWKPAMINDAFGQDDLYVEMTFLRTLEQYGLRRLDPPGGHRLRQQRLSALVRQQRRPDEPPHAASPRPTPAIRSSTSAPTTSTTRSRPTTPA